MLKRVLVASIVLCFLGGCQDAPVAVQVLDDYHQRLAYVQDESLQDVQSPPALRYPPQRELNLMTPRVTLSMLDALRLDQCQLGQLIANRNSSLGKLQDGISRLYADRQLLQALAVCEAQLISTGELALAERLTSARQEKEQQLVSLVANALAADDSLRHALSADPEGLAGADRASLAPSLNALEQLIYFLEQSLAAPTEPMTLSATELETHLATLQQNEFLPKLWRSLQLQETYLRERRYLAAALPAASGCTDIAVPERALIMQRVFSSVFAAELQPQLAQLTSAAYELEPFLQRLKTLAPQPQLQEHLNELAQLSPALKTQISAEVTLWQELFRQCGFTPGKAA